LRIESTANGALLSMKSRRFIAVLYAESVLSKIDKRKTPRYAVGVILDLSIIKTPAMHDLKTERKNERKECLKTSLVGMSQRNANALRGLPDAK
jgi:hypothetical protein